MDDEQIRRYLDAHPEVLREFVRRESRRDPRWLRDFLQTEDRRGHRPPWRLWV